MNFENNKNQNINNPSKPKLNSKDDDIRNNPLHMSSSSREDRTNINEQLKKSNINRNIRPNNNNQNYIHPQYSENLNHNRSKINQTNDINNNQANPNNNYRQNINRQNDTNQSINIQSATNYNEQKVSNKQNQTISNQKTLTNQQRTTHYNKETLSSNQSATNSQNFTSQNNINYENVNNQSNTNQNSDYYNYKERVFLNKQHTLNYAKFNFNKYSFGSTSIRFFAYFIDLIVAKSIYKMIKLILPKSMPIFLSDNMSLFVLLIYFFIASIVTNGSSIGKIIFNLQIKKISGEKLDILTIFIREVVSKFILFKLPILFIIMFFSTSNQSLPDLFADTVVINEKNSEKLNILYSSIENI